MAFASFPLDELGLTADQLAICTRANFTTSSQVLNLSQADLSRKFRTLKNDAVQDLVSRVSRAITPKARTVDSLLDWGDGEGDEAGRGKVKVDDDGRGMWIGTGDVGIDHALGGGVRIGSLTEITGESAAGKSHLTLTLSLSCQIPRLTPHPGGAIILTSERELPTDRLIQLAKPLLSTHHTPYWVQTPNLPNLGRLDVKSLLDNIHTNLVKDVEALDHALSFVIPALLKSRNGTPSSPLLGQHSDMKGNGKPIRLLIIDSITALLRGTETSLSSSAVGLTQRSRHLCAISDKLKALALEYNLAIVVINQVSDVFIKPVLPSTINAPPPTQPSSSAGPSSSFAFGCDGPAPPMLYATQARWFSGQSDSLGKEASLGIVWANAVNTRIMLSRTGRRRFLRKVDLSVVKRRKTGEEDEVGLIVDEGAAMLIRRLHVVFSAHAQAGTLDYVITERGVCSIKDSWQSVDSAMAVKRRKERRRKKQNGGGQGDEAEGQERAGYARADEVRANSVLGDVGGDEFDDEFGGDVFDDLGDLPAEFWEGKVPAEKEMLAEGVGIDY